MVTHITSLAAAVLLAAQAPSLVPRGEGAFDVASIRPTADTFGIREFQMRPGGRLVVTGMSLRDLVRRAYGTDDIQISEQIIGGPAWAGSDRYDIQAGSDAFGPNLQQSDPLMLAMVRALIERRFKLRVHSELRAADSYSLVVAGRPGTFGPALHSSTIDCPVLIPGAPRSTDPARWCGVRGGGLSGGLWAQGVPMKELARVLALYVSVARPVRDLTGLSGKFDFRVEFTPPFVAGPTPESPAVPNPAAETGVTLFTALQEQLGLKLQRERAPIPFLVIDAAEHPTEN